VPGVAVALALIADEPATRRAGATLFAAADHRFLTRHDLRPAAPFRGPLFATLGGLPVGTRVGLVVPCARSAVAAGTEYGPGTLLAVSDHVNLELRGPLTGCWPAAVPRTFPPLTGIYQPADVRALGGARVYSCGVVVAGVADAGRLTPFEAGALREAGVFVVSDSLVPSAVIAAYHGLTLAACGVPRADDNHDE
jgi:hypothetical protein